MITIKIFLIPLVVIISIHHASMTQKTRVKICEDLIFKTKTFSATGQRSGLFHFQYAYYNLTLDDIQYSINDAASSSDNLDDQRTKIQQATVMTGYFKHLLSAAHQDQVYLNFNYPEHWCPSKVKQMRSSGALHKNYPINLQEAKCLEYIAPLLFNRRGYFIENVGYLENGKEFIFNELYLNWSRDNIEFLRLHHDSLYDPTNEMPGVLTFAYTLGYYEYVGQYVHNQMCEKLLRSTNLFMFGSEVKGFANFQFAYTHITLSDIEVCINKFASSSSNGKKIEKLKKVTYGYYRHLLNTAHQNPEILNFSYPEEWCLNKVIELRNAKNLVIGIPKEIQAQRCVDLIVPILFKRQDYIDENNEYLQNGKEAILTALYTNCSFEVIRVVTVYALGYFNHVAVFVDKQKNNSMAFKNIKQYCKDEGNDLINY